MRKLKQNKGITLVALILTIVILLILAVVTIRSIQGEGIIAKAIGAREKYEGAADEEQGMLDKYLQKLEGISSGTSQDGSSSGEGGTTEEVFNPEEWDKGAPKEEDNVFIWKSDDPNSPDYGVVIGYTSNVQNYSILRYPTRCTQIKFEYDEEKYEEIGKNEDGYEDEFRRAYIAVETSRAFTNNTIKLEIPGTVKNISPNGGSGTCFDKVEEVVIKEGASVIEPYAFAYCENLRNITLPDSITSIEKHAFYKCENLNSITIPNGVTSIEEFTFYCCTRLNSVTIPSSVTSIGDYAFGTCENLNNIIIPNSVEIIDDYAFQECRGLTSVTIPSSVTKIGVSAFCCCTSLKDIIIPDSVIEIGRHAFEDSRNISNITLPITVEIIGDCAFYGWTSNQTVNCRATSKSSGWSTYWNEGCDANIVWGYTGE